MYQMERQYTLDIVPVRPSWMQGDRARNFFAHMVSLQPEWKEARAHSRGANGPLNQRALAPKGAGAPRSCAFGSLSRRYISPSKFPLKVSPVRQKRGCAQSRECLAFALDHQVGMVGLRVDRTFSSNEAYCFVPWTLARSNGLKAALARSE